MWLVVVVFLGIAVAAVWLFGPVRWRRETAEVVASLMWDKPGRPERGAIGHRTDLEGVPAPVARYFRLVLPEGRDAIARARLVQEGEFRMGEGDDSWKPFSATQVFRVSPPGFVWDATIRMAPGLAVRVRDSYDAERGSMQAAFMGLVPVVDLSGTRELAEAALQRFLAESVWLPDALLPSRGVVWSSLDASSARATLSDGSLSASLDFRFGGGGEIVSVFSAARNREVEGVFVPTPWEGRFSDYEDRCGMRIPSRGEVAWIVDGVRLPYWRGRVLEVDVTPSESDTGDARGR